MLKRPILSAQAARHLSELVNGDRPRPGDWVIESGRQPRVRFLAPVMERICAGDPVGAVSAMSHHFDLARARVKWQDELLSGSVGHGLQ